MQTANDLPDPLVAGRDDLCPLGGWIRGDGRALQVKPEFGELQLEHAAFHQCAAELVRARVAGDMAGVMALLEGEFSERSRRVVDLLQRLRADGGKRREQVLLAAGPVEEKPVFGRSPHLPAAEDDEWLEF